MVVVGVKNVPSEFLTTVAGEASPHLRISATTGTCRYNGSEFFLCRQHDLSDWGNRRSGRNYHVFEVMRCSRYLLHARIKHASHREKTYIVTKFSWDHANHSAIQPNLGFNTKTKEYKGHRKTSVVDVIWGSEIKPRCKYK